MHRQEFISDFIGIDPEAKISAVTHGWRAKCLQRLVRMGLPVPKVVTLPASAVRQIAMGQQIDTAGILSHFAPNTLISVRPSPANPEWGGPVSLLNIGLNAPAHEVLSRSHGIEAANMLFLQFIQTYAIHVARLDPDVFDGLSPSAHGVSS
ncbi:MAG: pyruvate,orthophosphate dikinase, partial [Paracoccaceae bacterium]